MKPTASLATEHLIECGCRRIAHIAGPKLTTGIGRLNGYRAALAAAGVPFQDNYVVHATDDASGYQAARRLLDLPVRPDAIFGYNDPTAAGAMKAILEAGIAIPSGIKVIGVGNVRTAELTATRATFHHRPVQHFDRRAGRRHSGEVHRLEAQAPTSHGNCGTYLWSCAESTGKMTERDYFNPIP